MNTNKVSDTRTMMTRSMYKKLLDIQNKKKYVDYYELPMFLQTNLPSKYKYKTYVFPASISDNVIINM